MRELFDQLVALCDAKGWKYESSTDRTTLCLRFVGVAGPWHTFVRVFEERQQIAVYGVLPFSIDAARRGAAAELVARISFGIVFGNFEMDFADGEVRCRTSLDFEGDRPNDTTVGNLVQANLTMMDTYIPAFVAFIATEMTPSDALALVE